MGHSPLLYRFALGTISCSWSSWGNWLRIQVLGPLTFLARPPHTPGPVMVAENSGMCSHICTFSEGSG